MSAHTWAVLGMLGAAWAAGWNVAAWWRQNRPWSRVHLLTAFFALFYVAAWGVLVFNPGVDRGVWSEWVTPMSTAAFFVVWTAPAMIAFFEHDPDGKAAFLDDLREEWGGD